MNKEELKQMMREVYQEMFEANYASGNPRIPPHQHNGIDNLLIASTGGSGVPAGNDTDVQFNDGGNFGGNDSFTFVVSDPDFGVPKITLGNSAGGGIVSGGDYQGGIGTEYFRITTNNSIVDSSVTRNLSLTTGDATGMDSNSGDIFMATGLGGSGTGVAGNIQINTGDFATAVGAEIVMRAGLITAGGNAIEITGNTLITGGITNPAKTYSPSASATSTLNLSLSNQHYIQMPAGNITVALSNSTNNQIFIVSITQDSGGSRTVTWFTTIRWAGGSAPTLTTAANKRDYFGFVRTGSGTYDGFVIGQNI